MDSPISPAKQCEQPATQENNQIGDRELLTISGFPNELLVAIFKRIPVEDVVKELEESVTAGMTESEVHAFFNGILPFKVAWVCRDWRDIALGAPGLWAGWTLAVNNAQPGMLDFLQRFIGRSLRWSRRSALDIDLAMQVMDPEASELPTSDYVLVASPAQRCDAVEAVFTLLDRERSRWRNVCVSVADAQLMTLFLKERVDEVKFEEPVPNSLRHHVKFDHYRAGTLQQGSEALFHVEALSQGNDWQNNLPYVAFCDRRKSWQIRFGILPADQGEHSPTLQAGGVILQSGALFQANDTAQRIHFYCDDFWACNIPKFLNAAVIGSDPTIFDSSFSMLERIELDKLSYGSLDSVCSVVRRCSNLSTLSLSFADDFNDGNDDGVRLDNMIPPLLDSLNSLKSFALDFSFQSYGLLKKTLSSLSFERMDGTHLLPQAERILFAHAIIPLQELQILMTMRQRRLDANSGSRERISISLIDCEMESGCCWGRCPTGDCASQGSNIEDIWSDALSKEDAAKVELNVTTLYCCQYRKEIKLVKEQLKQNAQRIDKLEYGLRKLKANVSSAAQSLEKSNSAHVTLACSETTQSLEGCNRATERKISEHDQSLDRMQQQVVELKLGERERGSGNADLS